MLRSDVTLRREDAIRALESMRLDIAADDRFLKEYPNSPAMRRGRDDKWESYQRIAKALGLNPTLSSNATP